MRTPPPPRRSALDEPLADEAVHLGDVSQRRREPGADRPDRLVGDDELAAGRAVGQRARELAADDVERRPASRSASVSPTQTIATSPARQRRRGLARARRRRSPCGRCGARNGRRSRRAPRHPLSISAEMSPVKAPAGSAWQSWPPIATASRPRAREARDQRRGRADQESARRSRRRARDAPVELGDRGRPCRSSSSFPQPKDGAPQPSRTPDRTRSRYQTACPHGRGPRHISRRQFNMLRRSAAIPMIATIRCALAPAAPEWRGRSIPQQNDRLPCFAVSALLPRAGSARRSWSWSRLPGHQLGIWGIGDIFRGYTRGALVTVGSAKMSADQFRQLFTSRVQAAVAPGAAGRSPGGGAHSAASIARCFPSGSRRGPRPVCAGHAARHSRGRRVPAHHRRPGLHASQAASSTWDVFRRSCARTG